VITGQIFTRFYGEAPTKDGRILVAVVGLIAVPPDTILKPEHQYVVTGNNDFLTILPETAKDMTEYAAGHSLGSLFTSPIWQC
jgi:hypothetical protein